MSIVDRVEHFDANQSTFNNIGRDQLVQTTNHIQVTLNIYPSQTRTSIGSSQSTFYPHNLGEISPWTSTTTGTWSPGNASISAQGTSEAVLDVDIVINLVENIVHRIKDRPSLIKYRDIKLELESFHQTLSLTGIAIQALKCTSLDPGPVSNINQHVRQCFQVLRDVCDEVSRYQQSLQFKDIKYWWTPVWGSPGETKELTRLRERLAAHQESLDSFLVSLNCIDWRRFGNHLLFEMLSARLMQRRAFLGHIPLITVRVIDHLGGNIPVPILFCNTWKDFHYIINGYCNDRIGDSFIKNGDYQVIRALDNQTIGPSEFSSVVKPGMDLEMSIVLRRKILFEDDKRICPRCGYINTNVIPSHGWIECGKCEGQFQVEQEDENNNDRSDREINRELREEENEEIISPASSNMRQTPSTDSDGTQFFRRIVVCTPVHGHDHRIVSFSGLPQTHPSLAKEGVTSAAKVPIELIDSFVCDGAVDVARLLRASRASLLERARILGGNALVEEQWKSIIYCSPEFHTFQVHIRYSASATRASTYDPAKPVALEKVLGVPGLMTVINRV